VITMNIETLADLELLDVGHEIQLYGAIYTGKGKTYMIPLPGEDPAELVGNEPRVLIMTELDMAKFLNQKDVLDIEGIRNTNTGAKAILRKSQRQVDQAMSWQAFRRDSYTCRYCGNDVVPLTVDHADLWEDGGATVLGNLVTACRSCNKLRGRRSYEDWLISADYGRLSKNINPDAWNMNKAVLLDLPRLRAMRVKVRSR